MGIDSDSAVPLYKQIAGDIERKVATGELPIDTRLRSYRKLAEDYGVSTMTINKALSALIHDGLLTSRVGRGTFVAEPRKPRRRGGRRIIGFVLRDLTSPHFSQIVRAAEYRAHKEDFHLIFSHAADSREKEDDQIQSFLELGVEGLVIASMSRTYAATPAIRALHDRDFPYVMVSFVRDEDIHMVCMDSEKAGFVAAEHLIRLGYERIGYINDGRHSAAGGLRRSGYLQALRQYGCKVFSEFEFHYPFEGEWNDYRSGYEVGLRVCSLNSRPDAVFAFNDLGAIGFEEALLDHGVRVPDDIAIVGVDDIDQSRLARVPLTTVHQPAEFIGDMAVDMIMKRISGEAVTPRRLLEPELIVRASTDVEAAHSRTPDAAAPRPAHPQYED